MISVKTIGMAAIAGATLFAATAAPAVTFASFTPANGAKFIRFQNDGVAINDGTGGTFTTFATGSFANVAVPVRFSFLDALLATLVTNAPATFNLTAGVPTGNAATGALTQGGLSGSFTFLSTVAYTVDTQTYAPGSNLLTGTFSGGTITGIQGAGTADASANSSLVAQSVTFSSDFLNFNNVTQSDFTLALNQIGTGFNANLDRALRSFSARATGAFNTNVAPVVSAVPEPAAWGLMLVGFGMIGMQVRRRRLVSIVA